MNLWFRNLGELEGLTFTVQRSALCNSGGTNVQLESDPTATTPPGAIDLGGGALGSAGQNDLSGGRLHARVQNNGVAAERNWWGSPAGPAPGKTVVIGTLDYQPVLTRKPALSCP
jgi:hypothetical protein